ncbi:MAG: hypothetical protein ACRBN8_13430 [Nannocystales bacterium]
MRLSTFGALIGLALAASGCQEQRSYAIRWRVEPRTSTDPATVAPQDIEMSSPAICSRAGVSDVEVWVYDELNLLADKFDRPCFPERFRQEGGSIRGATLSPGDYTLVIAGTRTNGLPWGTCPDSLAPVDSDPDSDSDSDGFVGSDETDTQSGDCTGATVEGFLEAAHSAGTPLCVDGECNVGLESCDCTTFTVEAEKTRRLDDFVLPAPPDCEDGIDGDADGLVDQLDPGCQLGVSESTPVLNPELELNLSVLSGNPVADCDNITVGLLDLTIDGNALDPIECIVGKTRFSTPLAVGPHDLTVTGLRTGVGGPTPATVGKTLEFTVNDAGVATPRSLELDFADVDLLEPLEGSLWFQYQFLVPGEDGPEVAYCGDARIGDPDVRYRVLDVVGQPIDALQAPLDGSLSPCKTDSVTSMDSVTWGGYAIEIESFNADGDVCWSNAGAPAFLTPRESQVATLELVDGAPPSCING